MSLGKVTPSKGSLNFEFQKVRFSRKNFMAVGDLTIWAIAREQRSGVSLQVTGNDEVTLEMDDSRSMYCAGS